MKNNYLKVICLLVFCTAISIPTFAQNGTSFWTKTSPKQQLMMSVNASATSTPTKSQHYTLNINRLKSVLAKAPKRGAHRSPSHVIVEFPNSQGGFDAYRILEASIMEEALQNKYPNIRSYVGQGVRNPSSIIRFSVTPNGLNTLAFTDQGVEVIDPNTNTDLANEYLVYNRKDVNRASRDWTCEYIDDAEAMTTFDESDMAARNANDGTLRTFRLALASTVEFSLYHGGTLPTVMAAMNTIMTRVNGIYEKELSITMVMVDNESIIFLGPNVYSDPYTNNNGNTMLSQNQTAIDAAIGTANYDIGHVFSTGGGGIAELGSPCTASKAYGVTGLPDPIGDGFSIDFVAHEMGHQFGANHTFNGNTSNCQGTRNASTAYEPGSGSTIMAYAGICTPHNVQSHSDSYFHQISLFEIFNNITNGGSQCATLTSTFNNAPTAEAGPNYTIPISTPYKLTGSSTDLDGTASHTYTWEEYDKGPTGAPTETTVQAPIVRSYQGTSSPIRYIPKLSSIIANGGVSTRWEKLASVTRILNFKLTVRDNGIEGGQTATDKMTADVNEAAGPFVVTSQAGNQIVWTPGTTETITWDVAGTNANGIDAANVNILLSTDGGENFDTILASNVANDGSQDVAIPNVSAPYCRIMVEAANNIFFNVNADFFAIGDYTYVAGNSCTDYTFNFNTQLDENDESIFGRTLTIPDSKTITDLNISVDVSTSTSSELQMGIRGPYNSPDGITYLWYNANSCPDLPNVKVTFDDDAIVNPCTDTSNNMAIQPAEPLSVANGSNSLGDWVFFIGDVVENDNFATLNSVTLTICQEGGYQPVLNTIDVGLEARFSVFPNPSNGEFTVKFKGAAGNVDLQVFDIRGRSVFNNSYDSAGEFNQTINLDNVQSGMYLLNIHTDAGKVTKKLIVK